MHVSTTLQADNIKTEAFKLFDGTLYKNKDDISECGFQPIKIIYEGEIFTRKDNSLPTDDEIKELAIKYRVYDWVIFDIERWDHGDDNIIKNINLYSSFIKKFKLYNTSSKLGYYGVLPVRDYWRASKKKGDDKYNDWVQENMKLKPLAQLVDAIFPSIYSFYYDKDGWVEFAKQQIDMGKIISNNKPVYPFIWPNYHESNMFLANRYIGDQYWMLQLKIVSEYADGVVVWGGWGEGEPQQWESDMKWWVATKNFLNKSKCDET